MILKNFFGLSLTIGLLSILSGCAGDKQSAATGRRIVDVRFDANYSQIVSSHGDEWAPTWADDGNLYTGNDDGTSFGGIAESSLAFGKLTGEDPMKLTGTTISDMGAYGKDVARPDHANWKTMNSYCVDGVLYMFVTRCLYPDQSGDTNNRHIFKNSSIIKSTDKGKTWTRSAEENYNHPMFPGLRFGSPYFVWYGQNGAASVDNADKYVYAVANNGHFEDGDNYILGRVLKKKLPDLNGADWEFYTGGNGMRRDNWKPDINRAAPILEDTMHCSMTGMTYIPGLGRYVMVVWHYKKYDLRKDSGTINDFYEAPKPWGPWTKFTTVDPGKEAWYVPIIGQKWQTNAGPDTVHCILYPTGDYKNWNLYKLNFIPVTFSTVLLSAISDPNGTNPKGKMSQGISESEAIDIAMRATASPKEKPKAKLQIEAKFVPQKGWFVNITSLPLTPGGFVTVIISQRGEVMQVIPGA